eukprot:3954892-Amphidinium_carterae.1
MVREKKRIPVITAPLCKNTSSLIALCMHGSPPKLVPTGSASQSPEGHTPKTSKDSQLGFRSVLLRRSCSGISMNLSAMGYPPADATVLADAVSHGQCPRNVK